MVSPARLCLICKGGRALCGNSTCPLLPKFNLGKRLSGSFKKDFFGPSYSVFVGRFGYPDVNIGPMAAFEDKPGIDDPTSWLDRKYGDIVELRSLLLRSKEKENIKSRSRFILDSQELTLSSKPTDVEMLFKKNPVYRVSFSDVTQPMGPSAALDRLRIAQNIHVPRKVDRIVSDEMKSSQASYELYKAGQDVHKVSVMLSSGVLGMGKSKKLVPTRWSITATDDMIFKQLAKDVRDFPSVNEYTVFSSKKLDNRFEVLLMPGSWEFENFEAWAPGSMWTANLKKPEILEEYEPFKGRSRYAELQGGGYYASRLGVIEGLHAMRRQARVVVFREVYEGYAVPLGVWQVRENVRNAFKGKAAKFATLKEALDDINRRLKLDITEYKKQSKVLLRKTVFDF
ncbi:MAG: hypothetical protein DRO99_04005 [Candidatus Aenigmatarchaeota archaeon]|nr:MAG: hypothetical protein DRO99_04005 [Candidatus Aenigmarchaeota archaeon]